MKNNETKPKKQRLTGGWPCWFAVAIASLIGLVATAAERGYLAVVGPCPLRFRPVFQPATNKFVLALPAPAPASAPAHIALPPFSLPMPAWPPGSGAVIETAGSRAPTQPSTAGPDSLPIGTPMPDGGVVSPQMILKYFNKSTNGGASMVVPMEFSPPRTAGPPPSPAIYNGQ